MRIPKKFQRAKTGVWYLQLNKRRVVTLGKDEAKAEVKANQLLREYAREGGVALASSPTFHDLIDEYTAWIADNRAPSKTEVTRGFWRDLKEATSAKLRANMVKPIQIEKFINGREGVKSPTTKHDYISLVSGMFNWGIQWGLVEANPLAKMPKPKRRVRQDYLPADRFQEFFDALTNDAIRDFVTVQLETGCRPMEMFKMSAAEFDAAGERVVFDIEDSKGNHTSRVIFLTPRALAIVTRLAALYPVGPIFRNTRGVPFNKDSINCYMRRLKVKLAMPSLCATTLRHSYAVWRLHNGDDPLSVAKMMGHKDTRMLATRYGHLEGAAFLATKAKALPMPFTLLSTDSAANGAQADPAGSERNGHADGAGASNGKATSRKRGRGRKPRPQSDTPPPDRAA